ncbi:DHHW family protein [Clostridium sardiniense]
MYKKSNINKIRYQRLLAVSFLLFLIILVSLNIVIKPKEFSEVENRMLAQAPKFSIDRLFEGRFIKKYEKYKSDQFAFRGSWINIKSTIDKISGKKESNGIYLSENAYLIESFKEPNDDYINQNINAINKFSKIHKNIKSYVMVAPNAISIVKDKLPKFAPVLNQRDYINNFKSKLSSDIKFIDTFDILNNHKNEYLYYRTDHHWTTLGAYYSYLEACKTMNLKANTKDNYSIERVTNDFYGTLSSKSAFDVDEPDSIDVYIPKSSDDEVIANYVKEKKKEGTLYDSDSLKKKDKYTVFLEGNHPIVKINTTSKSDKKLLLIKDSYANSFVQFLTTHYSEIVMVDPRYYYDDIESLIKNEGTTDILYLYNANTFFQDNSLAPVLNNE